MSNLACCTTDEFAAKYSAGKAPANAADCKTEGTNMGGFAAVLFQSSIDKKRIVYSGTKASECVAASKTATCGSPSGAAVCATVMAPQVAKGGACGASLECITGYCTGAINAEGTCETTPKEGEACKLDCEAGLACTGGKCAKLKAAGEACTAGSDCSSKFCGTDKKCGGPTCDGK